MIDQELKKKIITTINRYEVKCDKMQLRINSLKNAINQLVAHPLGIDFDLDEQMLQFQKQMDSEFEPATFDAKVNLLANELAKLEKKKAENKRMIPILIRQGIDSIGRLASSPHDKRAVSRLEKFLDSELEGQAILVNFNEVLSQCVSSVNKELHELKDANLSNYLETSPQFITHKVNESLIQLLNHLSIPENMAIKRESIKTSLESKLTGEQLSKITDELTDLLIEAFNIEQSRFKGFLQHLTNQLSDFDNYLKTSTVSRQQSAQESSQLESGIQEDINQIRNHIDNSKTIEELSMKISQNLNVIGGRIKDFRDNEKKRELEHGNLVQELQKKLNESESNAEEIKNLLSFQKYRINHDSLTGLPNRESYDEHMLEAFQRWQRHQTPLALAVADIDYFKKINDTFGHLAGDKILKKVASIFKASLRNVDFVARIGGEEFVLILEQTTCKNAFMVLNKLRKSVEECQFYYRENKVDVTVSFGVTEVTKEDDIESLFIRADKAMYKAKSEGRNKVYKL